MKKIGFLGLTSIFALMVGGAYADISPDCEYVSKMYEVYTNNGGSDLCAEDWNGYCQDPEIEDVDAECDAFTTDNCERANEIFNTAASLNDAWEEFGLTCLPSSGTSSAPSLSGNYTCATTIKEYTSCSNEYFLSDQHTCETCPVYAPDMDISYHSIDELNLGLDDELTLTQCAVVFDEEFSVQNGIVQANAIQCAVVTDMSLTGQFNDPEPGDRVCVVGNDRSANIICDSGYTLDQTGSNRYEDATYDPEVRFVAGISEIKCVTIPAGYFGSTWNTTKCQVGWYCPEGSAQPIRCPKATNVVGNVEVHGTTLNEGSTSIIDCFLEAGDIEYTDDIGTYRLKENCDYQDLSINPDLQ